MFDGENRDRFSDAHAGVECGRWTAFYGEGSGPGCPKNRRGHWIRMGSVGEVEQTVVVGPARGFTIGEPLEWRPHSASALDQNLADAFDKR